MGYVPSEVRVTVFWASQQVLKYIINRSCIQGYLRLKLLTDCHKMPQVLTSSSTTGVFDWWLIHEAQSFAVVAFIGLLWRLSCSERRVSFWLVPVCNTEVITSGKRTDWKGGFLSCFLGLKKDKKGQLFTFLSRLPTDATSFVGFHAPFPGILSAFELASQSRSTAFFWSLKLWGRPSGPYVTM